MVFLSSLEIGFEECEDPRPLQPFHAVSSFVARAKASNLGLLTLFKEYDKYDLYGRKYVYWAITPQFALKLLRCQKDIKNAREFNKAELEILKDLEVKGWIKKLCNGKDTFYYGLNSKTAAILKNQLKLLNLGSLND